MQPKTLGQRTQLRDDRYLLDRVQRGDEHAFEQLFERHGTAVYSLAVRILGEGAEAEEVLSDVFWQLWRRAKDYEPDRGSPLAWIMTVARSRALDRLRAQRRRAVREQSPRAAGAGPGRVPSPERVAMASEAQRQVSEALAALPLKQRTAIELAYFEGLTHVQVASRLEVPLGTVKTRIRTGMQRLCHLLKPHFSPMEP